jgi:pyrroline-5-carboxylate reductase
MSAIKIGFIGGGRIVSIVLAGLTRAGVAPDKVVVCDTDAGVLERLKAQFPQIEACGANPAMAAAQDIVFLALHPPVIKEALDGLKMALRKDALLVSLAPKFTIAKLSEMLGGFERIARVIPNAPSIVGQGFNPVAFGPALSPIDREALRSLLLPLGACPEAPEHHLEIHAIVAAMGPTYLWPQLYELKALAEAWGLSAGQSLEAIDAMVGGAAATMIRSGLTQDQVMDLIPVKPLADEVAGLAGAYRSKLQSLYEKIKP